MSTMRIARFAILLAVAFALVITGAVAGAAGQALILGQSNAAGGNQTQLTANLSAATLKVSQFGLGSPLSLKGPTNKPPMVVNSKVKVEDLNADRVDGKNAAAFMPSATYVASGLETIAAGNFASATVFCDAGDPVLSGGHGGFATSTTAVSSQPELGDLEGWQLLVFNGAAGADVIQIVALCADVAPHH